MSFTSLVIESDPDAIEEALYERLAEAFPGWTPAEGNLEVWIARWLGQYLPDLAEVAGESADEVFSRFGETILSLPPIAAAAAVGVSTWTMADDAGYTIPIGTQIEVAITGSESVAFETTAVGLVAPGETSTDIEIAALIEGVDANQISGTASPVTALPGVSSIVITDPTSDGVDGEDPVDYRDRLAAELRLLAPRPILPADAATLARRIAGVERATAVDLYDPGTGTYDNERTVAVAVVDAAGDALDADTKTAVETLLEAEREVNFVFHVIDPTYTTVDIDVVAVADTGYDPANVEVGIAAALAEAVSPVGWGVTAENPTVWIDNSTLRRNELLRLVGGVQGVAYVSDLTLVEGGGVLGTADVALDAPASLPVLGVVTIAVS